jgi:hypothetical protein
VVGGVDNPAKAALLGTNRNDYRLHGGVHHSHSYLSILIALSHNIQERMKNMAIREVDTSSNYSIARTHGSSFNGRRADGELGLAKRRNCHLFHNIEVRDSLLHVGRRVERGHHGDLISLYKECSF